MFLYRLFDWPTISILLINLPMIFNLSMDKSLFSDLNSVFTDKVRKSDIASISLHH